MVFLVDIRKPAAKQTHTSEEAVDDTTGQSHGKGHHGDQENNRENSKNCV